MLDIAHGPVLNRIEHRISTPAGAGSSPAGVAITPHFR